jgi:tetratricopeptide (TPR) repeat protein
VEEAEELRGEGRWPDAVEKARVAVELAGVEGVPGAIREETAALLEAIESEESLAAEQAARDARDRAFVARLYEIRARRAAIYDNRKTSRDYREVFAAHDLDLDELTVEEAAEFIRRRPPQVAAEIVAALDEWSRLRRNKRELAGEDWESPLGIARRADPDPWRNRLRTAAVEQDLDTLLELASKAFDEGRPLRSLNSLAVALQGAGDQAAAVDVLRRACRRFPSDPWLNSLLAYWLPEPWSPPGRAAPGAREAVRHARAAVAIQPRSVMARTILVGALLADGRVREALEAAEEAVRLDPASGRAHASRGRALLHLAIADAAPSTFDEARQALEESIRRDPGLAEAHLNLGVVHVHQDRNDRAIEQYRLAIRLEPDCFVAWHNLGRALGRASMWKESQEAFARACELDPSEVECHWQLGRALRILGKHSEAHRAFERALVLDPNDADARFHYSVLLRVDGRMDESLAELEKATQLRDDYAIAWNNLGVGRNQRGEHEAAVVAFRKALAHGYDPAGQAWLNLGSSLYFLRRWDEAREALKEGLTAAPDLARGHGILAWVEFQTGNLDAAIESWRRGASLGGPLDANMLKNASMAQVLLGDLEGALRSCRRAVRLKPASAPVRHELGYLLAISGDLAGAEEQYREAIRFGGGSDPAGLHCWLAQVLIRRARFPEALRLMAKGHELGSRDPDWEYPSASWVRQCRHLVELAGRKAEVLDGRLRPEDAEEALAFALLCATEGAHADAASHYESAFAMDPALAEGPGSSYRNDAAYAAGRAVAGLDPDRAAALSRGARKWLSASLARYRSTLREDRFHPDRYSVLGRLGKWKVLRDLGPFRTGTGLPSAEGEAWREFWDEVEAVIALAWDGR